MKRLRLVFAGSGEFGLPTLKSLLQWHDVVKVFTQPDRPAGRGRQLTPTPIGSFCRGVPGPPTLPTADLNAETLPECDVLVVIAFGQKISEAVTGWPRLGAINLHASRLPKYRGAAPIHRAILAGETVTGNSIIRLAPKMDAGAVLAMSEVAIGELETTGELHDRLALDGAPLVLQVLQDLDRGTAVETEQDHSLASIAKKITREQAVLDFSQPARELACMVRGLYPWPGCRVEVRGDESTVLRRLTPVRARAVPGSGTPGEILPGGTVGTGEGLLEFVEVQPEGGRPMPLSAFRNGHPWPVGGRLRGCV